MAYRVRASLAGLALAVLLPAVAAAASAQNPTLRVMLHPDAAPQFALPAAAQARLEAVAGASLAWTSTTRTGALELALAGPRDAAQVEAVARRLRADRSVLWVQNGAIASAAKYASRPAHEARAPARKFLVRLNDGVAPDWQTLLPRLSARLGAALAVERSIGNVWVLSLPHAVPTTELEEMADALQQDEVVRYADPVRRLRPKAVPNDPLFARQWSLTDPLGGINLPAAWALGTGRAQITVAVIDTGSLDHPDLAGRQLPGYDFITSADTARDGGGRDADSRDEGDWVDEGDCGGEPAHPSFWHGLFVTGLIAANSDNGVGIAGVDWAAKILPVRALGKCGGTYEDVFEAMLWAAGAPIAGVPANANPAKVINMSLGGYGSCGGAFQEAVDDALAQGTIIVAAAGNETDDAENYAPGNCGGVITVGATTRDGDRTGYSNFGRRVDLSAPGGDGDIDGLILSTFNDGAREPGNPGYAFAAGTSFSAPLVSGTVSLMLARNPNLTAGQVLSLLQGTARDFPIGSACRVGGMCGVGLLDAGTAVASTIPAIENLPPGAVAVVELYDATLDHYMLRTDPSEIAAFEASGRWSRTGHVFYAYADPSAAPAPVSGVCRFYAGAESLIDSYFYTADPAECSYVAGNASAVWTLETTAAFWIEVPDAAGMCRPGTLPVYRFFNNRRDASQRHTVDLSVRRAMVNRAWVPDGPGVKGAALCSLS